MKGKTVFTYLLTALMVGSLLMASACKSTSTTTTATSTTTETVKNPDTFIEEVIGDPQTLDPAAAYDTTSDSYIELVYNTLVVYHKDSTTQFDPSLADSWTVSADGMTYRFHIRTGVKFSNGDLLTPDDVKYSFERGMVQDYSGGPQWLIFFPLFGVNSSRDANGNLMPLSQLTSAITVDGDYVQFKLDAPFPPFLQILAGGYSSIVDKAWCIAQGDWDGTEASYEKLNNPAADAWPLHEKMMGTGPFTLNYWTQGSEIAFTKNTNYWGPKANFTSIVAKDVQEWTDRKLALEAGDADYVDVGVQQYSELDGVPDITVVKGLPTEETEGFFFTYDISPNSSFIGDGKLDGGGIPTNFFTDINIRKAFAYSFDYNTFINQVVSGNAVQPDGPIISGLTDYNPNIPKYTYDTAKAIQYFQAAWGGQVWTNGFTMTLAYNSGNTTRQTACDILAADINALNPKFHVTSAAQQWSSYASQWDAQLLPVFVVGWLADYLDASDFIEPFMSTTGAYSQAQGYGNATTDALINAAAVETNTAKRQADYDQLSTQYYNDCPGVMIEQPTVNRYMRSWVKGFFYNPAEVTDIGCDLYYLSKGN
ncbi:MAG: ABC transporter substrate-binding protein [Dehalococcoidales bacterium]|jgi:peptide/nickel transport system substrate-binding protein